MSAGQDLHRLLDSLPERELHSARRFLEFLRDAVAGDSDPLQRAFLTAPEDDEPLTEDEAAGIDEARKEAASGSVVPFEPAVARSGHQA